VESLALLKCEGILLIRPKEILAELVWAFPNRRAGWLLLSRLGLEPPPRAIKRAIVSRYRKYFGREPDLEDPKTWTEKLQWMKLNDRNPAMVIASDKYAVREFVASRGYEHILIELLGVYSDARDIDFSALPAQFVLKPNHDSGGVIIVRDKSELDETATRKKLARLISMPFLAGVRKGEWQYVEIEPRIIAETYLGDVDTSAYDYKIHCFHGVPKLIFVGGDIDGVRHRTHYDLDWNNLDIVLDKPQFPFPIEKPKLLDEMLAIARGLSDVFPYVRVDLYYFDDRIYFGELSFFHHSGFGRFEPIEWDYTLGSWLDLKKLN